MSLQIRPVGEEMSLESLLSHLNVIMLPWDIACIDQIIKIFQRRFVHKTLVFSATMLQMLVNKYPVSCQEMNTHTFKGLYL